MQAASQRYWWHFEDPGGPNGGSFDRPGATAGQAAFDVRLRAHRMRVYNYLALGLALSGTAASGPFSSAELASLFFEVEAGRVVGLSPSGTMSLVILAAGALIFLA
jgi:uncharacterized protein